MTRIDDDEKDPTETTAAYRRKLTCISIMEFNSLRLFLILDDSKISTDDDNERRYNIYDHLVIVLFAKYVYTM